MNARARLALALLAVSCLVVAAEQPGTPASDLAAALRLSGTLQSRVRFDHLTTVDGLSNDSVFSILQDRRGFLWFGTQAGLNRYDGHRVTQFRHDPRDPDSISGDFIHNLLEDRRGAIWTGSDTLSRFDPQTERFTHFALPRPDSPGGGTLTIQRMREDRSGFVWLGMSGGRKLYRFDPGTGKFTGFDISRSLPPEVEHPIVGMYADPSGILWLGAAYGLIRFDPSTGTSTRFTDGGPLSSMSIRGVAQDPTGNLWLATTEGGQNFFDPVAGAFARRWSPPHREHLGTETNTILSGIDGVIWLGKMDGLELFDPATGSHTILQHNAADRFSLSSNEIQSLAVDREGSLWAGTKAGGVDRFSPASLRFGAWRRNSDDPRSLSDDNVRAICRDRAGVVWLGTYDGGLNRFDPVSGTFTHFRHDPRNSQSLDSDRVYSIYEDRAGDLWVGTSMGINRLDRQTGTFAHFRRAPLVLAGVAIPTYALFEDSRGTFWFGAGEAKASLDRRTGAVESATQSGGLSMHEDREGNLWFASARSLTRVEPSGKVHRIALPQRLGQNTPSTVQINFIHEDAQGLLWFASETGLFRFDPKTGGFTTYTTREGLPDNVVQCVLPDKAGNLWLSTNNGLSRFNPRENTFSNYHESDGLQGETFNRKACFVDNSGIMYFGGQHGFNIFDPRRIPAAPSETSRVILTEFRIHGSAVPVRAGSVLPRPVWQMSELHLPPEDNGISFEFAALKFTDQARIRYRFTLEGLESKWTEVDSRSRSARYTGLRPEMYRFRVQASTDGKTWSSQEASIGISIAPPWWMTWRARGGAILALSGLLFGAYRLRVRSLYERGVQLQKVVDQRTAELVEANRQAQQARVQAEQANRTKSVFLANMSHELRTPLNAILGFSHLLRDRVSSQDQRQDLDVINRSGEHLLTLINDLLDVAKIEAGRTELVLAPCDLKSLVMDVLDMMRGRAEEKLLGLALEESPGVPRYVLADAARLREVLINLLGNAIKYTEHGSITLRSSAQPVGPAERMRLRFEIEDTGVGIVAEDQERIFKPFEQVARPSRQKGTGLGLAITRHLVELMGGTIRVESTPGKGSWFRVEIPVDTTQEFEAKPVGGRKRILGLEDDQPEYRILVVEDEQENWMVLDRLLREAGFQVRVAENGEQGIVSFREWRPQFIWMDLHMPEMDGIEATRRIRELEGGRDVTIAALTASGFVGHQRDVLAAGLDEYVAKPFRPEEIFECMERHLGVRYRRDEGAPPSGWEPTAELSNAAIAALPAALRAELRNAVVTLNGERISRTIGQVAEFDPMLAAALARCAKTFQYTVILNAVEGSTEDLTSKSS